MITIRLLSEKGEGPYRRFLGDYLDSILKQFDGKRTSLPLVLEKISEAIEGIFINCGISFETVNEGVYIRVTEPQR